MSLASQLVLAFQRVAAESKALRTLINGNVPDLSALNTTTKTSLVASVNEVNTRYACKIYVATSQAIVYFGTGGSGGDIPCSTLGFNDSTTYFDTTTNAGKITVKVAGLYRLGYRVRYNADGGTGLRDAIVKVNGTQRSESGCYTNNVVVIPSGSEVMRLAVNDVVSLAGYADSAAAVQSATTGTDCSLVVTFIGK